MSDLCKTLPEESARFNKCKVGNGNSATFVGMNDPKYCKLYLQYLLAFKVLVKSYWEDFVGRYSAIQVDDLKGFNEYVDKLHFICVSSLFLISVISAVAIRVYKPVRKLVI